ncbi:uncharacterized protein [Palaemon carinicauda]|uniref:uncharacterized protein n=1 Tax=Palaemon carinicauda TaxID=392227 RepID=UPI0035B619A5
MKWFYSKETNLTDWVISMYVDDKKAGRSFLLNIFYSGNPLPPNLLSDYISQLYGKTNLLEIHFGDQQKALVILKDPIAHDKLVMRFKSCMFSYRCQEKKSSRRAVKEYVRIEVYNIYPMAGVVEFNIENGLDLIRASLKHHENGFSVLAKVMQIHQPSMLRYEVITEWDGKDGDDTDIVIRFFSTDVRRCREYFFKEDRKIELYSKEYKVFYARCIPAFTFGQHIKLPTISLPDFTCIKW